MLYASVETIVESHCLIVSRNFVATFVEVDVTIPQTCRKVVGVVAKNGLSCCCRKWVLTLCVCTEYCLAVFVDVVGEVIPRELHGKCALLEESCLAVYLGVNVLATSGSALTEKDVESALVLSTSYDVDTKTIHLCCVGVTRTHEDFLAHLLGYMLKGILADKIFWKCCHNCCVFVLLLIFFCCLCRLSA